MAKSELTKTEPGTAEMVSEQILSDYLDNLDGPALNDKERRKFINTALAFNLNPFKREIHCNLYTKPAYGNQPEKRSLSVIVGYEVYIKRAERTGKLDGWETEFLLDTAGELYSCIITIYRKDQARPFKWEVFFAEQAQYTNEYGANRQVIGKKLTSFWEKKYQQLRKVAISQGFRLDFPDENGGIPYTADEMPQYQVEDTTATVVEPEQLKAGKPAKEPKAPKYPETKQLTEQELYNGTYQEIDSLHSYTELGNIEDRILNEPALSEINKVALLKHCISRRAELIKSVDQATQTARRLANLAATIGPDNVTAMFGEIIEACEKVNIEYKNKKFQPIEPEPELAEVEVNLSGIITDDLPI